MSSQRTIIFGGPIHTLDPQLGEIDGGALLLEDGRIRQVVQSVDELDHVEAERIDADGGWVLPGMVDSHRHTWMSLMRGVSADQSLLQFLATIFTGRGSLVQAEDTFIATRVGALEALDAGVTTILDCHDCVDTPAHANATIEALRSTGIRSVYAYGMQHFDYRPVAFPDHADRLADARRVRAEYFSSDTGTSRMAILLADFGLIPFHDTAEEIRTARELDVLHASHTGAATTSVVLRGLRELHDHELLLEGHLHNHCPALTPAEWRLLAETRGRVTIAPETEMQMGMGVPPFRAATDAGLHPGISTDIVCVGSGDLFSQMRLGLQLTRCLDHDRVHAEQTMPVEVGLTVADALLWATRNSAEAIGLGAEIGSLTPGKRADVIVMKPRMGLVRSSNPIGSVVLQSTAADVDTVLVDQVVRKRHGRLVDVDVDAVRRDADAALDRLEQAATALPQLSDADISRGGSPRRNDWLPSTSPRRTPTWGTDGDSSGPTTLTGPRGCWA